MGYYYTVKFKKKKKEWSEKFPGSGCGKHGQKPAEIRSWLRRVQQRKTFPRFKGARITAIKKVTPKRRRR